ncbi:bactofilin family protein [Haloferula rosea]|uniref:Polymer-forming cytoskeletal protein n=1 Tax=Haloferula rosea TaxID=490093 RepID=A0A934R903_9BACT|nr:polymer-forming cytoskeletal protein [Haloferula rosea]MBK1825418.1 polymer-forming cytoskeletal protein [Haloferula rosea]
MFRKVIGQKSDESSSAPASQPAPESQAPAPAASAPPSTPASAPQQPASRPQASPAASRNVLSSDVDIKGSVKFTNDLVVDGKIEGEISSDGNLTVGENARLKAEIKTATVVVYGKVHGNITASDRVDLKASAEVVGDIKAKTLTIEAGAIIVGKSTVGTPSTPVQGNKPAQQQGNKNQGNKPQQQGNGGGNKPQQGNLAGIKN